MSAKSTAKSVGKRLAMPFTRRVYGRIDFRADQLHQEIQALPGVVDQRTAALEADIEALNRYLPTVVNTIASQNAASRETERRSCAQPVAHGWISDGDRSQRTAGTIVEILDRIGDSCAGKSSSSNATPRHAPRPRRRLHDRGRPDAGLPGDQSGEGPSHAGATCGSMWAPATQVRDAYLNVDCLRGLPGIDIVADVRELCADEGEVMEIYSARSPGALPGRGAATGRAAMIGCRCSKDGGKLVSVVPDVETMVSERAAGRMPFGDFIEVMYGGQEYEGDFHFSGVLEGDADASPRRRRAAEDVKVIEEGRRNGACYEMEIEAVRRIPSSG